MEDSTFKIAAFRSGLLSKRLEGNPDGTWAKFFGNDLVSFKEPNGYFPREISINWIPALLCILAFSTATFWKAREDSARFTSKLDAMPFWYLSKTILCNSSKVFNFSSIPVPKKFAALTFDRLITVSYTHLTLPTIAKV